MNKEFILDYLALDTKKQFSASKDQARTYNIAGLVVLVLAVALGMLEISWHNKLLGLAGICTLTGLAFTLKHFRLCYLRLSAQAEQAESLLRLTEALLQTNRDCIKLLSPEGLIRLANPRAKELMAGKIDNEQQSLEWINKQAPEVRQALNQTWLQALKQGYGEMQAWLSHNNGETGHFHISMSALGNDLGRTEHMLIVTHDISQLVESKLASEKSNNELNELLDSLDGLFMALDEDLQVVYSNARARNYLQSFQLLNINGQHTGQLPALIKKALTDTQSKNTNSDVCSADIYDPDTGRWMRIKLYPKSIGFNLFIIDINDDYLQKQALQQALMRAELVQELEAIGSWEYQLESAKLNMCQPGRQILGISQNDMPSNLVLINRLLDPQDRIALTSAFLESTQQPDNSVVHCRIRHTSGDFASIRIVLRCLKDSTGTPIKIIGTLQDVTEQKAHEAYLQEAERFVRGIIDSLPSQVCVIDEQATLLNANRGWKDFGLELGFDSKSFGRGANYIKLCESIMQRGQQDIGSLLDGIQAVINKQQNSYEMEFSVPINQRVEWFTLKVNPLLNPKHSQNLFVITHENITPNKLLMLERQAQSESLKQVLHATNDGIWDWQIKSGSTYYSQRFQSLIKRSGQPLAHFQQWLAESLLADKQSLVMQALSDHLAGKTASFDVDCQLKTGDGSYRWFRLRGRAKFEHEQPISFVGSLMDISEQRKLMDKLICQKRRFQDMAESIPDVFWDYDIQKDCFVYVSPAFENIWRAPLDTVEQSGVKSWLNTLEINDRAKTIKLFCSAIKTANNVYTEYRINTGQGEQKWVNTRAFVVTDDFGKPTRLVGSSRDITQAKLTQNKLLEVSRLDTLTGLPNRAAFINKLDKQALEYDTSQQRFALAFIDLDRLVTLNDSMGHDVGDELICQVARRLTNYFDGESFVARIGGDEFGILIPLDSLHCSLDECLNEQVRSFNSPFVIRNNNFYINVSIGAATMPHIGLTSAELMRAADAALLNVKNQGGGDYHIYQQAMPIEVYENSHIESELRLAIEKQQFEMFYQVKVDAESGVPMGCEALLRWRHPDKGLVSPLDFIPQLECSGLINTVGEWILQSSLQQLKTWHKQGHHNLSMAINVSARQIASGLFSGLVKKYIQRYDISPNLVELELTESALMADTQMAKQELQALKALGVNIAIDDFGTGFSSLSYLRIVRPNTVKIDKHFVDDIEQDPEALKILQGIVHMNRDLQIHTVAEGVETEGQWDLLRKAGCDTLQGYLFAKPVPEDEFTRHVLSSLTLTQTQTA